MTLRALPRSTPCFGRSRAWAPASWRWRTPSPTSRTGWSGSTCRPAPSSRRSRTRGPGSRTKRPRAPPRPATPPAPRRQSG
ncbi:MAG: hypothetical protein EXR71_04065 [Myxococcales bacterium]|nr:hypothetical protein [Myxococcales bacterium]